MKKPTPPKAPAKTKVAPPPPPKKTWVFNHPKPEAGDTHLEFTSSKENTVVVCPIGMYGDFSSAPGTVRYGRLRWNEEFIPADRYLNPPEVEDTDKPTPPPVAKKPAGLPKEGVCAFIDARIMEGGRTAEEVLAVVMEKFPGRDARATLSTIKVRPSHIKAKGQVPPPFKK
jgi:hypothetical protein